MSKFDPDWVVSPGETLREWMEATGSGEQEARECGIDPWRLARLLNGLEEITPELAASLCLMTRISQAMWLALERTFREGLAAGKTWSRGSA